MIRVDFITVLTLMNYSTHCGFILRVSYGQIVNDFNKKIKTQVCHFDIQVLHKKGHKYVA